MSDNKTVSCVIRGVVQSIYGDEEEPDLSLVLDQNFLLSAGSTMGDAALNGPTLTLSRASTGTYFDENGLLVTAAIDAPRFDHDPGNSDVPLGLLCEPAATNQIIRSEEIDNSSWVNVQTPVITANDGVAPDGTTTMELIEDDNSGASEGRRQDFSGVNNSETWVTSCFIRKDAIPATTRWPALHVNFRTGGSSTTAFVSLDTSTGASSSVVEQGGGVITDAGVIDAGDHWRLWIAFQNDASGNTALRVRLYPSYGNNADLETTNNSATGSCHWWGVQSELGTYPSSYIPTVAATVTRAKDVISTTDLTWYDANTGTMFFEGDFIPGGNQNLFNVDDGTTGDYIRLYIDSAEETNFRMVNSGGANGFSQGNVVLTRNTIFKKAGAYAQGDMRGCIDGTLTPAVGGDFPLTSAPTIARFGEFVAAADQFQGHIRRIKYWDERKSDSFMQSVTS